MNHGAAIGRLNADRLQARARSADEPVTGRFSEKAFNRVEARAVTILNRRRWREPRSRVEVSGWRKDFELRRRSLIA